MRINDVQLGQPEVIYKGTKAAIEAAFAVEGMEAWATDTHEPGHYDGTAWVWGSGTGATTLHDLTDVDDTGKADGDSLVYNGTSGKWEPTVPAGGAHDAVTVSDSSTVDLTLTGQALSAAVIPGGIDAADLASGAATDGYVLTADGAGGAAWEAGGAGGAGVLENQVFN